MGVLERVWSVQWCKLLQVDGPLFSIGVWREAWIPGRGCGTHLPLTYLQTLVDNKLAPSVIRAVAISSSHKGSGERSVFVHPLVKSYLKEVRRQNRVMHFPVPQLDLPVILHVL